MGHRLGSRAAPPLSREESARKQREQKKEDLQPVLDKFVELYGSTDWSKSRICDEMKINIATFQKWQDRYPDFREALKKVREYQIDVVEDALMHQITQMHNTQATIFFLKCKGRGRGWVDKQEIEHSGKVENPVQLSVLFGDDDNDQD